MKSFITVLALAAGALAQIPGLPTCANGCISLPKTCQLTDYKCICSDNSFISDISCCVFKSCNSADQETALKFAIGLCGGYGVSLPMSASCPSSSASAAASSAAPASSSQASSTTAVVPAGNGPAGNGTVGNTTTVRQTATVTSLVPTTTTTTASAPTNTAGGVSLGAPGMLLGGIMAGMVLL